MIWSIDAPEENDSELVGEEVVMPPSKGSKAVVLLPALVSGEEVVEV